MTKAASPTPVALRLSEEAQDFICSFVSSLDRDSSKTLCSLALTHSTFVDSARRSLYRNPLDKLAFSCYKHPEQLYALTDTLSNSPHLAAHVRDLSKLGGGVVSAASALDRSAGSPVSLRRTDAPDNQGYSPSIQWSRLVLEACTQVEAIEILPNVDTPGVRQPRGALAYLLQSVHPGRLKTISLKACGDLSAAYEIFGSWTRPPTNLGHLDSFRLAKSRWGAPVDTSKLRGQLPFTVVTLSIDPSIPTAETLACYPADLSSTKVLKMPWMAGNVAVPTSDIMALFKPVAHQLETFEYRPPYGYSAELPIAEYASLNDPKQALQLPSAFFSCFVEARNITLGQTCMLTLDSLRVLAANSPKLEKLLLPDSVWTDISLDDFAESLVAILQPLPLTQLDIGLIPVVPDQGEVSQLVELEEYCRKQRIEFTHMPCAEDSL